MTPRLALIAAGLVFLAATSPARADDPPVEFDAPSVHPWTEIKPPAAKDGRKADHKAVLIVIPISANFNVPEERIDSIRYTLRMPDDADVIDFLPGTQTGTELAGDVKVAKGESVQRNVKVSYGAQAGIGGDLFGMKLNVGGNASREQDDDQGTTTNVQYSFRPALQQVIVAGTKEERKVLYYDLKKFNQVTRAGVQDFAILAVVPKDWTEAAITLSCSAREGAKVTAETTRTVAVYLGGDDDARKRAKSLIVKANGPASKPVVTTNTIGMKFAAIPAGEFEMGSPPKEEDADSADDERPRHKVKISAFRMGVTEVTVGQFRRFVEETGYKTEAERTASTWTWSKPGFQQTEAHPVILVSWNDAVAFCNWLSRLEGRKEFYKIDGDRVTVPDWSADGYRLPTEAEWEYACRAGTKTRFSCPPGELGRYAWYSENAGHRTHPVGEKLANRFGLHDMHGNAWEWCWDGYDRQFYEGASLIAGLETSVSTDSRGPSEASDRVIRGGGWNAEGRYCRSAIRNWRSPGARSDLIGLRIAAVQSEAQASPSK